MKLPAGSRMTDYLLGRLAPADQESVREEVFASEEVWNELAAAEEELIDSYARGELDADDRALVEERLLWSEAGQEKLRMARALLRVGNSSKHRRIWAVAVAAAAVVLLVAGFSVWRGRSPRVVPSPPAVIATLTIPLSAERGPASVPQIKLPLAGTRLHVELRLAAPELASNGMARFLFRDVERSYTASINGALAELEFDRRDLHEGPCQIELTASGKLLATGSVVFTQ